MNKTETVVCEWCGKEINKEDSIINVVIYELYGFFYCSEECMMGHINSK